MALNLTPNTQALAKARAESKRTLAALKISVEDYAAGHWISLEDYEAEVEAKVHAFTELSASVEDHAVGHSMTIEEYRVKSLARCQERNT